MLKNFISLIGISAFLTGCVAEKLSRVGSSPQISEIQNPTLQSNYIPISMPMSRPSNECKGMNSLWQTGSKSFFKDQRARKIGDLVTINIAIDNKESTSVTPSISRQTTMSSTAKNLLGLQTNLERMLPSSVKSSKGTNNEYLNTSSKPQHSGAGKYDVEDKINFQVAATVIQVLPNGNMVIVGKAEIKLLNEVREIGVKGIVRASDVKSDNSVDGNKVAELRILYTGRGDISDAVDQPWGNKVLDKIMPF
jgi:flagellar L-ring protein precursor FlgH